MREGDVHAFKEFYELTSPVVYGRLIPHNKDGFVFTANSILERIYKIVWRNRENLGEVEVPLDYLLELASEELVAYYAGQTTTTDTESVFSEPDFTAFSEKVFHIAEGLPEVTRDIFLRYERDGMPLTEIALQYGIAEEEVQRLIQVALSYTRVELLRQTYHTKIE